MYTDYIIEKLGCSKKEAIELEFEPIILFKKLNIAIGSFYNKTDEPYIIIYNSIYTDPDDNMTPTKILKLSLIRNHIINKSSSLRKFSNNEIATIIYLVIDNWDFIRELYLYTYISKYGKCINIPETCPYSRDKYITNIDTEYTSWKWVD